MKRLLLSLCFICASIAWFAPSALAGFTAAEFVSGNSQIPFEEASSPALSADGNYVVFQGKIAGVAGIYRRDLQTHQLEPVAAAANTSMNPVPQRFSAPDAAAPSVSAEGRYIAFTSTAELDTEAALPSSDAGCPQVYVRDMTIPPGQPGAYVLASALSEEPADAGVRRGIEYIGGCPSPESRFHVAGAQAAAGVALSANGQRVAFTVLSSSDLEPNGTRGERGTTGGQVVVRDLETRTTTLMTATPEGAATLGGGAYPSSESEQRLSLVSPETIVGVQPTASTAAISADGTTTAWLGTNVPQQVPPASDVVQGMNGLGSVATEVEPLWRRVSGGPTVRLLAGAGLNFYFAESREEPRAVNGGTLYPTEQDFVAPALSADGSTVVTISNAPTAANEGSYQFLSNTAFIPSEAYVINVDPSSLSPQVTPLTATPNFTATDAIAGAVTDVAVSPNGSHVAFNTRRTSFALAPPSLISPPAPEEANAYTYEVNLDRGTLQNVIATADGLPPNGTPGAISFTEDGQTLAFASAASNLIFGTPTSSVSQVYLLHELPSPTVTAIQSLGEEPAPVVPLPDWILSATAYVDSRGDVNIDAEVPGAGRLRAQLTAQVPEAPSRRSSASRSRRRRAGAGKKGGALRRGTASTSTAGLLTAVLAQATTSTAGLEELKLSLRVDSRFSSEIHSKQGLYCLVQLSFAAAGHSGLSQTIPLVVRAVIKTSKHGQKTAPRSTHRSRRQRGKRK